MTKESKTPWLFRALDPRWRPDHKYGPGDIRTGSDGIEYVCLVENGPDTKAGIRNPVEDEECWDVWYPYGLTLHLADFDNPHKVTAEQLGLACVYRFVAVAPTMDDLPDSADEAGDVYHVAEDGTNWVWNGSEWQQLSGIIDLSAYLTTTTAAEQYATVDSLTELSDTVAAIDGLPDQTDHSGEVLYTDGETASWGELPDLSTYLTLEEAEELYATKEELEDASSSSSTSLGSSTVGGAATPIYLNSGVASPLTATVGSSVKPVYLSGGTIKALSKTVGSGKQPVYLDSGKIVKCDSSIGSGTKPVYMSSGVIKASSSTVGGTSQPVYLNSGTLTAISDSIGNETTGVYLDNGVLTACSEGIGTAGSTWQVLNYSCGSAADVDVDLPDGGTWAYLLIRWTNSGFSSVSGGIGDGGSTICTLAGDSTGEVVKYAAVLCWQVTTS